MASVNIKHASVSFKKKIPFEPKMDSGEKIGFSINGVRKLDITCKNKNKNRNTQKKHTHTKKQKTNPKNSLILYHSKN